MRTNNLLIGTTALAIIAAAFAGLLGYRKVHSLRQEERLRIIFEGSADGVHKGGIVTFDGVQIGEVISLKLESPRRIVVLARVDKNAPLRKDTLVGLQSQGLTGLSAIALTGGEAAAPPVPLDKDGIPVLTADLSETLSIRDSLHNVDRFLVSNQDTVKSTLRTFEADTASLARKGEAIDGILDKADSAFESFDSAVSRIDSLVPGMADGNAEELFQKVKSLRELAESFNKHSGALMEEGRRSLQDISEAAVTVTRKFDPQAASGGDPVPPKKPRERRP